MGFEQANKYAIKDPNGVDVGFIAEEDGLGKSLMRNFFHTHRRFNAMVMDTQGNVVLKIHRPFSFINSRLYVYSQPDNQLIGEVHQQWHLWRRKYNLFNKSQEQFAKIDMPLLSWEFEMIDESGKRIGMVGRNFSGFMREIFTDTGQYVVRMDAASAQIQPQLPSGQTAMSSTSSVPVAQTIVQSEPSRPMTLDERAVALACAVSIDFDYFSRHSGHRYEFNSFFSFRECLVVSSRFHFSAWAEVEEHQLNRKIRRQGHPPQFPRNPHLAVVWDQCLSYFPEWVVSDRPLHLQLNLVQHLSRRWTLQVVLEVQQLLRMSCRKTNLNGVMRVGMFLIARVVFGVTMKVEIVAVVGAMRLAGSLGMIRFTLYCV
ncbi:Scramblase-domain-containing protein [Paraphysoderma sedebokerense]|nr:Scramblase-domain-containing protein [Paraphysoderma sedebokerense]